MDYQDAINIVRSTEKELSELVSKIFSTPIKMNFHENRTRLHAQSDPILNLGISYFIFEELRLESFGGVWFVDDEGDESMKEIFACIDPHFSYKHSTGGSNGCEASIMGKRIRLILKKPDVYHEGPYWESILI